MDMYEARQRKYQKSHALDLQRKPRLMQIPISDNRRKDIALITQMANENSRNRTRNRERIRAESDARQGGARRAGEYRSNWQVVNFREYLSRHNLNLTGRSRRSDGKITYNVTDGSIIVEDIGGRYWRHESATTAGEYYDINHNINANNAETHFSI